MTKTLACIVYNEETPELELQFTLECTLRLQSTLSLKKGKFDIEKGNFDIEKMDLSLKKG